MFLIKQGQNQGKTLTHEIEKWKEEALPPVPRPMRCPTTAWHSTIEDTLDLPLHGHRLKAYSSLTVTAIAISQTLPCTSSHHALE